MYVWYFVTKIVLTYCENKCSSDWEILLKLVAEGREFAKLLISLKSAHFKNTVTRSSFYSKLWHFSKLVRSIVRKKPINLNLLLKWKFSAIKLHRCTEEHLASFIFSVSITMTIINPVEKKLANAPLCSVSLW